MEDDPAKQSTRRRFDENFVKSFEADVYERIGRFFDQTSGTPVLVMLMHSWSFLGYDSDLGHYVYQDKGKRDAFERFLQSLPSDYQVITARELSEKWENGEIETTMTLNVELAEHE